MDLAEFKTTFDGIMQTYIDGKIQQTKKLVGDKKINTFVDYIQNFIFSGGKRIRPYVLRLIYMWFGWQDEKAILNFGIIFELFHSMALIHDDIIDQSTKRHNIPTLHSFIWEALDNEKHAKHIAEWQAMLIGDLILAWVYELSYQSKIFSDKIYLAAKENVHSMIEEVILWQMIDVDMTVSWQASLDLIDKKNNYKTASYTFIRPMLTWAILAGASEKQKAQIIELWRNLWFAFQIKDDLMDITGGDKTKSSFTDIQEWQQTYFTNYIFEKWSATDQKLLRSCLGKNLNSKQITALQKMFETSWAIAFGREMITDFTHKAKTVLEDITFTNTEAKSRILALIKKMEK